MPRFKSTLHVAVYAAPKTALEPRIIFHVGRKGRLPRQIRLKGSVRLNRVSTVEVPWQFQPQLAAYLSGRAFAHLGYIRYHPVAHEGGKRIGYAEKYYPKSSVSGPLDAARDLPGLGSYLDELAVKHLYRTREITHVRTAPESFLSQLVDQIASRKDSAGLKPMDLFDVGLLKQAQAAGRFWKGSIPSVKNYLRGLRQARKKAWQKKKAYVLVRWHEG